MTGETADRHPGEHARPGSPPGWYADPIRGHSLRRWDGEHWTADVDPPAAVAEFQPSAKRHAFNWPVLAATLVAAWYVVAFLVVLAGSIYPSGASEPEPWVGGAFWKLSYATLFIGPPVFVLLGLLGIRRRYSTASRFVPLLLIGGLGLYFLWASVS
jgi:hypothetical protein